MSNETDLAATEIVPLSAIHAMERAQIDTQVATAHQYPRSIEKFKSRSLAMATLDLETAESCIYCRPVGKEKNDRGQWVEKFAEGPSIRLAEIVACCYGNLRAAARVVEQTPRMVKAEGACHDLETNYAGKSDCVESTVNKNGEPYSERQAALTAKVACAKAYRDAIFRVVPRALCKPAYEAAKKIVSGDGKSISDRVKRVQKWLEQRKIHEKRALSVLGIEDWTQITEDHLMTLTGLRTAVQDGDDPAEIFPMVEGADAYRPEPTGLQRAQSATTAAAPSAPANPPPTQTTTAPPKPIQPVETAPAKRGPGRPPKKSPPMPGPNGEKLTAQEAAEMRAKGVAVAPEAVQGEAEAPKPQSEPLPTAAAAPEGGRQPAESSQTTDEAELAALGLAPEPEEADPATVRPPFQPVPGESEVVTNLRRLMYDSEVTEEQLMKFCTVNKLALGEKTLKDFVVNGRTAKLAQLSAAWKVILPKVKA